MSFILSPTAAGVGTTSVTATGSIASGATVIMNSDGTVTSAGNVSNNNSISYGAASTIVTSANVYPISCVYDTTAQKVVAVYATASATYAIVGTVSGTTISWGTPVSIVAARAWSINGCFNTGNGTSVFIISHNESGSYNGYAFTISVSGTVPTIGTLYSYYSAGLPNGPYIAYDTNANKCLIVFGAVSTGYANAIVATVSGTTISFGTTNVWSSNATLQYCIVYNPTAQKLLVFYNQNNSSTRASVATISGTSVSFGTETIVQASIYCNYPGGAYDPINNKIAMFWGSGSGTGYAAVATISDTNVSFGTPVVFTVGSQNPQYVFAVFNSSISKIDFSWSNASTSAQAYSVVATISGTTITFGNQTTTTATIYNNCLTYDSNNQKAILVVSGTNAYGYVGSVGTATNLTTTNFFGISTTAVSTGQSATINTIGAINSKQTGLTAGTGYYVQNDGTLGTTAASPSVFAGLATSATSILIKG